MNLTRPKPGDRFYWVRYDGAELPYTVVSVRGDFATIRQDDETRNRTWPLAAMAVDVPL